MRLLTLAHDPCPMTRRLLAVALDPCPLTLYYHSMLTVSNLSKSYGGQLLFDSVTFTIGPQERVGLVGRNGSGKTTLFRLILGEEEYDTGTMTMPRHYSIGHLTQQLTFTRRTVLEEACTTLRQQEDNRDVTYKVKTILLGLGFSNDDFQRNPAELSSGFQIRLGLARVLAGEPSLLLLDEPTNYLDIVSVRWLKRFLIHWKNQLILITHDRAFMDAVTTHTMGIHRKKIRKIAGPTAKLYDQLMIEEEVYERTRIHEERKRKELEAFIDRFRAQATRARAVQSRVRALEKKETLQKLEKPHDLDFQFRHAPFHGKWLLEAHDISFGYGADDPPLIETLSLAIARKDRIALVGKNGKGKTTLLNLLAGELQPRSGQLTFHENLRTAYFGQANIERLDPTRTIEAEVLTANGDLTPGSVRNICGAMLFEGDAALKKIGVLSGGERSRVLLAKLLASPVNLLLLDEPTNHLDMESVDSLIEAIEVFPGAVVIATHSEMVLHATTKRLVVFDAGAPWFFQGTYQDFLDRVGWKDEEMLPKAQPQEPEGERRKAERKELRRARADLITSRSRALSPLQKRIDGVESKIMHLEERIKEDNLALVRASQYGDGKSITALSISIHEARKSIEALFEELETLSVELHEKSAEFEVLFKQLEERD